MRALLLWALTLGLLLAGPQALAQTPTPGETAPPATPVLEASPSPSPTPVALADIATILESSRTRLKDLEAGLNEPTPPPDIEAGLEALSHEVTRNLSPTRRQLAQGPSALELRELESQWKTRAAPLPGWKKSLTKRANELDAAQAGLQELEETWKAAENTELPRELEQEVRKLLERMEQARDQVRLDRNRLLIILDRLNFVDGEIQAIQAEISATRTEQVKQIFVQDSPALWRVDFSVLTDMHLFSLGEALQQGQASLADYCRAHIQRFLLHLLGLSLVYLAIKRAGIWIRPKIEGDEALVRTAHVFATPLATSLLLAYVVSPVVYPQPPTALRALLGMAVLIPAGMVLKFLLDSYWHPTLRLVVMLFLVDQIRELLAPQVLLCRLILTAELTVVLVFLAARAVLTPKTPHPVLGQTHRIRALTLALIAIAWTASLLGFTNLGTLVGQGAFWSAYLAIFLLAMVKVLDGLIMLSLRTPPLALLPSVQNFRPLYCDRMQKGIRLLARVLWLLESLNFLGLRSPLVDSVKSLLTASLKLGGFSLSLGTLITLVLAVVIPLRLSRLIDFFLEHDIYPRLGLTPGHAYTFSRLVHYALLTTGALIGLSIVGLDTTKLTIVAGALSVGIGFGLQNIVNNFVSGLILLFERPIQVGDQIEVGGLPGTLQRIGIRASVLRTPDGSEVIVPNGELISTRVTNWTLSDRHRLIRVEVGVEYGSSLEEVQALLLKVASEHPEVSAEPEPDVLLLALADSSINLQLRAWTENSGRWVTTRSELLTQAYQALTAAGITIPFPQRTVHLVKEP